MMLAFTQIGDFGDFRSDFVGTLAIVAGQAKAESIVTGIENFIRDRAKEGAEKAIPVIQLKVKKTVQPLVITAGVLGAVGAATGIVALLIASRKKAR